MQPMRINRYVTVYVAFRTQYPLHNFLVADTETLDLFYYRVEANPI